MARKKKSSILEGEKKAIPPEVPVNPDLTEEMLVDIAVNKDSDVWVFHNEPFPGVLEWAEYDMEEEKLTFITKQGRLNDLGIEIKPLMSKYLRKAKSVTAYLVNDKKLHDFIEVPLLVRTTLH